ncbi:MAG: 2-amino-4-hydroxy-6-hydroxymethyldihydropteridine diphosphokinase [Luteimonas sp.]
MTATRAYVGLGGNLGEPVVTLRAAIAALDGLPAMQLLRASQCYRTPAWGLRDQADFVNAVACLETTLAARTLLDALLGLERDFGRDRDAASRWGPRTLDLDLLLFGDAVIDEPGLRVPHPHLHERAFALVPLFEIAPDAALPGHGSVRAAYAAVATDGIEAITCPYDRHIVPTG